MSTPGMSRPALALAMAYAAFVVVTSAALVLSTHWPMGSLVFAEVGIVVLSALVVLVVFTLGGLVVRAGRAVRR